MRGAGANRMTVLTWQLIVGGSVIIAHKQSRAVAFAIVLFWTIWTIMMLFSTRLVLLQLAVAWGAYYVMESLDSEDEGNGEAIGGRTEASSASKTDASVIADRLKDHSRHHLQDRYGVSTTTDDRRDLERKVERALAEYSPRVQEALRDERIADSVTPISNSKHHELLVKSIKRGRSSILILSGWVSSSVIDADFKDLLFDALQRGVNVYVGYGYQDSMGRHSEGERTQEAESRLRELQALGESVPGNIVVGKFGTHAKVLIIDREVMVCGSHNWLSNRYGRNDELSVYVTHRDLATHAFDYFRTLIESNAA